MIQVYSFEVTPQMLVSGLRSWLQAIFLAIYLLWRTDKFELVHLRFVKNKV